MYSINYFQTMGKKIQLGLKKTGPVLRIQPSCPFIKKAL